MTSAPEITKVAPFLDAIGRVLGLVKDLRGQGIRVGHLDVGGGLGIQYDDEDPPHPDEYGEAVKKALRAFKGEVLLEPAASSSETPACS